MQNPNPYSSVVELFNHHRVALKRAKKFPWRLTSFDVGQFRACPGSHGRLVAIDGVLAYIELPNDTLFLGHILNFVPDETEAEPKTRSMSLRASLALELAELLQ